MTDRSKASNETFLLVHRIAQTIPLQHTRPYTTPELDRPISFRAPSLPLLWSFGGGYPTKSSPADKGINQLAQLIKHLQALGICDAYVGSMLSAF